MCCGHALRIWALAAHEVPSRSQRGPADQRPGQQRGCQRGSLDQQLLLPAHDTNKRTAAARSLDRAPDDAHLHQVGPPG